MPADTIGTRIAEARDAAGLSQAELARRVGVHSSMICRYESGVRNPRRATVRLLAAVLGLPEATITGEAA